MQRHGAAIAGTGSYVPAKVLTNFDLERMVDTSDEWIRVRTGIRERRIAAPDEPTSAIAYQAAVRALESAGVTPDDLDLIIVATLSPDTVFPNTACHLQKRLETTGCACFSIEAACSGFIYALEVAANMIRSGRYRTTLIVGAEKLSALTDWQDRSTCILFGDGAGAAVLTRVPPAEDSLLAVRLGADGTYTDLLRMPAGGTAMPVTHEALDERLNYIKMAGREVFKLAVNAMVGAAEDVLREAGIAIDAVRWLVPHQANQRIISAVGQRLGIADERVFVNVERFGNTSAATVPMALDEIARSGEIQRGDYVLLVAFGGGLTWAAALLRW